MPISIEIEDEDFDFDEEEEKPKEFEPKETESEDFEVELKKTCGRYPVPSVMPIESPEISEEEPQSKPRAKEEAPKRAIKVPEEEEEEEELPPERPMVRNNSNGPRVAPSEVPKKHHHKNPKGVRHRKHRDCRSERPVESPEDVEAMFGNFGLDKKEEEVFASSSSEDDMPSYTFGAPVPRISRSPPPVRRATVTAPNRRFVPSSQKVQQIDENDDLEITGTLSKLGMRLFAGTTRAGMEASAGPSIGKAAIRSTTP